MKKNPEVDAYLAESAAFARPMLKKIRSLYHKACPEIQETIKWGFPHFEYQGVVGSMAAFKAHVSFGFWKGQLMKDPHQLFTRVGETSMNARKVKSLSELPSDEVLIKYIREAVELNEQNVKVPKTKTRAKPVTREVEVPAYFWSALKKNPAALATFEKFSPSHRREYVTWISEAKQEATRQRRLSTAIEWLAEGKVKDWKYLK